MHRERITRIVFSLVAAVAVCLAIAPAESANLRAVPSLGFEERWDSNVFNTPDNEKSDFVFRVSPKLTLSIDAFQTTVNLGGGFDAEKFSKYTELDKGVAAKNVDLTTAQPLKITPQLSVKPSFRFVETRDAVRRNELAMSPEPGGPVSEFLVTRRTEVQEISGSLQMMYVLTQNVDIGIGGGGVKRDFTEAPAGVFDSSTISGNAYVSYRVNPRYSTGIFLDTSKNYYEDRPSSQLYSGGLTAMYHFSEKVMIDARAGASLDRESTGDSDNKKDTWSPTGRLSISYAAQDYRAMLLGSYDLSGGGSLGRTTKRTTALLEFANLFAPKWSWNISASYQTNRSTEAIVTEDLVTIDGRGGITYQAAKWVNVYLSGNVFRQWSNGVLGDDLMRHSVMLGLTLSNIYPIF